MLAAFIFLRYRADVVLLQELVPPYLKILKEIMTDYEFLAGETLYCIYEISVWYTSHFDDFDGIFFLGNDEGYFIGILIRRCRMELVSSNIVKYPTTEMQRNLLMAEVSFQLCYLN